MDVSPLFQAATPNGFCVFPVGFPTKPTRRRFTPKEDRLSGAVCRRHWVCGVGQPGAAVKGISEFLTQKYLKKKLRRGSVWTAEVGNHNFEASD